MHLPTASTFPEQLPDPPHIKDNKHHQKILKVLNMSHTDTTRLLLSFSSVWYEQPRAAGRHATTPTAPLLKRLVWSRFVCQLLQHQWKISKKADLYFVPRPVGSSDTAQSFSWLEVGKARWGHLWWEAQRAPSSLAVHTSPPHHLKTQLLWNIKGSE